MNHYGEPINASILAKKLGKFRQQVSPVLKKLKENGLIDRNPDPKLQKRGGKSLFIFLTEDGKSLLNEIKSEISIPAQYEIEKTNIASHIKRFQLSKNLPQRERAIYDISHICNKIGDRDKVVLWEKFTDLNELMNQLLKDLDILHSNIISRLFEILRIEYSDHYYNPKNIINMEKYIDNLDEINSTNINYIITLLLYCLNNDPDEKSSHYKLFIKIIERLKNENVKQFFSLTNPNETEILYSLPEELKNHIREDVFSIMGDVQDSYPRLLNKILNAINEGR